MSLFVRPNGTPMQFHLADLPKESFKKYVSLIEKNGGKVEVEPHEKALVLTLPKFSHRYLYVFDVKFIDDCIRSKEFENVNMYFIGDSRFSPECTHSKMMGSDSCLWYRYGTEYMKKALKLENSEISRNNAIEILTSDEEQDSIKSEDTDDTIPISPKSVLSSDNCETNSKMVIPETDSDSDNINFTNTSDSDFEPSPNTRSKKKKSFELQRNKLPKNVGRVNINDKNQSSTSRATNALHRKSRDITIPTSEMIKWAKKTTENLTKDDNGYPRTHCSIEDYKLREHLLMIKFLTKWNFIEQCDSLEVWQLAYNLKLFPKIKTNESLRLEMMNVLLPTIEDCNLTSKILNKFLKFRSDKGLVSKLNVPSEELIKWAEDQNKDKIKTKYGYPARTKGHYPIWEKELMVQFLIKAEKIHEAKVINPWRLAAILKIFPRQHNARSLQFFFRNNVMPQIREYNLPKVIEDEFLKLI